MKRGILLVVLSIMTVLTLTACKNDGNGTANPTPTLPAEAGTLTPSPANTEPTPSPAAEPTGTEKMPEMKVPVVVEGAVFGGSADSKVALDVVFDPAWLTDGDNTKQNGSLAGFAAILSADTYFREKDLAKGTQNRVLCTSPDEYTAVTLLRTFGFQDAVHIETFKEKDYATDGNDSATLNIGYAEMNGCDVFAVAIRGCFSIQEWLSIFDPGCDCEAYYKMTGEHPEWTDRERWKGPDIAASRAMEFISSFVEQHDSPERENCILITGHSRGGVLANLIGAEFEKRPEFRSFTYTFNTTAVTGDPKAPEYRTIFNYFDSRDFYIAPIPFGQETFYRYGTDVATDIAGQPELCRRIAELSGRDGVASLTAEQQETYAELFGGLFPTRQSLYEDRTLTETFDSREEAERRRDEIGTLIGAESGLGLEGFCNVSEVIPTEENRYGLTLSYCDGTLLAAYAKLLAYGEPARQALNSLFAGNRKACDIADFLTANAESVNGGHLLLNSYVLTERK